MTPSTSLRIRNALVALPVLAAASGLLGCLLGCLLLGCGGSLRFADKATVWAVDDRKTIPEPEENEYLKIQYFADIFALRRSQRALEFHDREPAWNVNAMEEVPDSSWFENRMGTRALSPAEIARGPADLPPPQPPFKLVSGKVGGGNLGFIVVDAAKRKFLFKFDRPENPEMQTGTSVAGSKLVWAFGFSVPRDYVLEARRTDIVIADDATAKDEFGDKIPYTPAMLDKALASGPPPKAGVYRTSASELLEGKPVGGWLSEGVRHDDPNDVVPHEHRREIRGLRVLAAWINHTDMKQDNTLDMYVERDGRKYVQHHLIDFGEVFGGHAAEKNRPEDAYEHFFDYEMQGKALIALGLWKREWEDLELSPYKSLGWFSAKHFHPAEWREAYPYWPFWEMDPVDAFWGAKIVMSYRHEHILAAAQAGKFTEPGATEYLVKTLEGRRDAIGRVWLEALSALDAFEVRGGKLCATDLAIRYRLATVGSIERLDDDGDMVETAAVDADARACVQAPTGAGYEVVTLRVRRGTVVRPPLEVHITGGRIVGLVRDTR